MENASKALIIAGAILLAIAIIGIGMYVFSSASSQVSDADLSKEQIETFNSKFERYEGTQNGTKVKLLLDTIRNSNSANPDKEIKFYASDTATTGEKLNVAKLKEGITDSTAYAIVFHFSDGGLIDGIIDFGVLNR